MRPERRTFAVVTIKVDEIFAEMMKMADEIFAVMIKMEDAMKHTFTMTTAAVLLTLAAVFGAAGTAGAQTRGVVVDMETGTPVKGVDIIVNGSYINKVTTDYRGGFYISGEVKDLTFIRSGFVTRVLNRSELKDTIDLLPAWQRLNEVVVYGKMPGRHMPVQSVISRQIKEMNIPRTPSLGLGPDGMLSFLRVFEKGHVSEKKRRERMKAIEDY